MLKRKSSALVLGTLLLSGGGTAYADFVDGLVGGVVGGVVGSVITNEVYRNGRRHHTRRHRVRRTNTHRRVQHKRVQHKKVHKAPIRVLTPQKKIQTALKSLGFYHGMIDGEINSYESRSAVKAMNNAYERGSTASLDPKARDTLIYLGDLFTLDRYLSAQGNDARTKAKRLQAALKIHGTYHGAIDGAVGPGTRRAISAYTGGPSTLDFEAEYQLIERARKTNDRNIQDAIASLKGREHNSTQPAGNNQPVILKPAQ